MTPHAAGRPGTGGAVSADLLATYRQMLSRYVEAGQEDELEAAYGLGRLAFEDGITILQLVELHRMAVEALLDSPGGDIPAGGAVKVLRTFGFLAEALGTFEMVQRGYREAQERARLEQERAMREHAVALMLQQDLLPPAVPSLPGFELAVRYQPGEAGTHAGGDWYDLFEMGGGRAGFVVGDVTGHGVGAAARMGQLRIAVLAYALAGFAPVDVVTGVDALAGRLHSHQLATMIYVVADPAAEELVLVNAGHPPPLIVAPDGRVRQLAGGRGRLLGVQPPAEDRHEEVAAFPPGSRLVLYTDGLIEAVERNGQDGIGMVADLVSEFRGDADGLCELLQGRFAPQGAKDDICIVVIDPLP